MTLLLNNQYALLSVVCGSVCKVFEDIVFNGAQHQLLYTMYYTKVEQFNLCTFCQYVCGLMNFWSDKKIWKFPLPMSFEMSQIYQYPECTSM